MITAGKSESNSNTRCQKEIVYNKLLPYADKLDAEANRYLAEIKFNLGSAITRKLIIPEGQYWIDHLAKYIKLYGYKFTKSDHCHFIHLLLEVITIPDLALHCVQKIASVLHVLLKKIELLSREDLQIDWRVLYTLFKRSYYSSYEATGLIMIPSNLNSVLTSLIVAARPYFSVESTQEMLDEWRPLLCPFDVEMYRGMLYLELFLCTKLPPHQHDRGFKLWLDDFLKIWESCDSCVAAWENKFFGLFARVAKDNVGYINWEPYIPMIFNKIIRSLNLPCGNGAQLSQNIADHSPAITWIVNMMGGGSSCLLYIDKLFKALESYYHPSNNGRWMGKLHKMLQRFSNSFVLRVHRERYKAPTWETPVPSEYCLTDAEISQFVSSLKPAVFLAMFSKIGFMCPAITLHNLAMLQPESVIPPLIERLYSSLETVVEPHRLVAAVYCLLYVARSMVQKNPNLPEGPGHVLPLLMGSLPGIDPNDIKKCLVTFHFITTMATLVLFVDCSKGNPDLSHLSEVERDLVLSTAAFEDFVMLFLDRCFLMVEHSSFNHPSRVDRNTQHLNPEETVVEGGLAATLRAVLAHCSKEIFENVLKKLFNFISTHIFEIKVSGKTAANLCRSASQVNPELTLKQFVPHFVRKILSLTDNEEVLQEESLDNELLFSLQVLSEVVHCDGNVLLPHLDEIEHVLERTLHLKCQDGYNLSCTILGTTLKSLTLTYAYDYAIIPNLWKRSESPNAHELINEWCKPADLNNLEIDFHVPNEDELQAVQRLLEKFLLPELKCLQEWVSGDNNLTRKEVQCSLTIVINSLNGAASVLPTWQSPHLSLSDSPVAMHCFCVEEGTTQVVNTSDGKNFRLLIFELIQKVLDHMMKTLEDATKSLLIIINIYYSLVFLWGISREEFDAKWKVSRVFKRKLGNQLLGRKQHIRPILVNRTCLQHQMRVNEKNKSFFSKQHSVIMQELTKLSVSHYSDVRAKAQSVIHQFLLQYEDSYKVILPELLESLKKDPMQFHEEFKGALYLTLAYKQKSLVTIRSWDLRIQLWPAIVNAKHSEKPSIIKLMDAAYANVRKYLDTIQIEFEVPERCCVQAKKLWDGSNPLPSGPFLTDEELLVANEMHVKSNSIHKEAYLSLVQNLVELIKNGNLHWRPYRLAFVMLTALIRYDIRLPGRAVELFVTHLIHDTLSIRKVAISAVAAILKQQKRSHPEVEIDPLSPVLIEESYPLLQSHSKPYPTSTWLQYNSSSAPQDEVTWSKKHFVHKTHSGFSHWPKPFKIYAPDSEQPKLDRTREELSEEEKVVYDSFVQEEFVEKLINYLCIEERKGHDTFDDERLTMFKGLFRNFGDTFLPHFVKHLKKLTQEPQESHQICAAEIVSGMIKGSKHWGFKKMMNLKDELLPILDMVLQNVTPETLSDWSLCMSSALEFRDPNKYYWLFEFLMERHVQQESGSFLESSWMHLLLEALYQQEWRVCELLHRLLAYLTPRLNHSYHIVRKKIGGMLSYIFMFDIPLHYDALRFAPKRSEFLRNLLPNIAILESSDQELSTSNREESNNCVCSSDEASTKRKDAINLFHTICVWIMVNISKSHHSATPEMFQIFPVLCSMQNDTSDAALHRYYTLTFSALSKSILSRASIDAVMSSCKQVEQKGSWHSRVAAVSYIKQMAFSNLFTVMNSENLVQEIQGFVLRHLHDQRVEVREAAAETLGSLIHYAVVPITKTFLSMFRRKCRKKLKKTALTEANAQGLLIDPEALKERHAGILGLCACVNAYPYDVPDFMPDVLMTLGEHLHDPQPIQATIKKTLSNFRRTHHDSWRDHKLKFTDDQLAVITELLVSPNYYA